MPLSMLHHSTSPASCRSVSRGNRRQHAAGTSRDLHVKCMAAQNDEGMERRSFILGAGLLGSALAWPVQPALAEGFFERGMSKYIKKKRLDPLDTYVPVVLQARDQLLEAGKVMVEQPTTGRDLLRKGAFDGLRENIRVLGEYAVINKKEAQAGPLVNSFFRSLEDWDLVLALAVREEKAVDATAAQAGFEATLKAIDNLLATVPEDIMYRSKRVLEVARAKEKAAEEEEAALEAQLSSSSQPASSDPAVEVPAQSDVAPAADAPVAGSPEAAAGKPAGPEDVPWPGDDMPGASAAAEPGQLPDASLDEGVLAAPPAAEPQTPPSVDIEEA